MNRVNNEKVVEGTSRYVAMMNDAEREALVDAGVELEAVVEKEYSYRILLDEGVDETAADALRRRFSLPWSFETDGDLDRRSTEVRGLGDVEREWIAESGEEDWQEFEAARARIRAARDADDENEDEERPWPRPTPVGAVTGVGPDDEARLAEGGIRSAECLATVRAGEVAKALDLNVLHVRTWRHNARELVD